MPISLSLALGSGKKQCKHVNMIFHHCLCRNGNVVPVFLRIIQMARTNPVNLHGVCALPELWVKASSTNTARILVPPDSFKLNILPINKQLSVKLLNYIKKKLFVSARRKENKSECLKELLYWSLVCCFLHG